jgi:hypothetical protein
MDPHQIPTSRQPVQGAHLVRLHGDYDLETLDALRAFLADLAWADQGE